MKNNSLLNRFVCIFLISVTLLGLIIIVFYQLSVNSYQKEIEFSEKATIRLQYQTALLEIQTVVSDLLFLKRHVCLQDFFITETEQDRNRFEKDVFEFSSVKKHYDQIRFLDSNGMEVIRVNYNDGQPTIVPKSKLQQKHNRYYFKDAFCLDGDEIFISQFDLNIEHGEIERPFKPMIRFAVPVYDHKGEKRGIIVLNYFGSNLLSHLKEVSGNIFHRVMLVNSNGYWLKGLNHEDEWGFMIKGREDRSMPIIFSQAWQEILRTENGQFYDKSGLFTFSTIFPLISKQKSSSGSAVAYGESDRYLKSKEYYWKVITYMSEKNLCSQRNEVFKITSSLFILLAALLAICSFFLARILHSKKCTQIELKNHKEHLEELVEERATEIQIINDELQAILVHTPSGIVVIEQEGDIKIFNPAAEKLFGYSLDEVIGKNVKILAPEVFQPKHQELIERYLVNGTGKCIGMGYFEVEARRKDGSVFAVELSVNEMVLGDKFVFLGIVHDISDRKQAEKEKEQLEVQLVQAQKMEAIGTLAGGIAHDFNNILSPILGYAEMIKSDVVAGSDEMEFANEILLAANRAKELVKQILAFSRQTEKEKTPINLQPVIKEALKLLRSSIPSTIEFRQNINKECGMVLVDPTQIHQIIMNLCTNAFHAIDETGVIEVTLEEISNDKVYLDIPKGFYIKLTVSDTGHGMDKTILDRIFNPYFTTKEKGKGTGLGLSVVHGIVKSCGGEIFADSNPRGGTKFVIFFPRASDENIVRQESICSDISLKGNERILIVDDEESIAKMEGRFLKSLGYKVMIQTDSREALEVFKVKSDKFDLIITDFTMPGMTGISLSEKILNIRNNIPIIICTGSSELISDDIIRNIGIRKKILKPVSNSDLVRELRIILDG